MSNSLNMEIYEFFCHKSSFITNLHVISCSKTQLPKLGERLEHVLYWSTAEEITESHATENKNNDEDFLNKMRNTRQVKGIEGRAGNGQSGI